MNYLYPKKYLQISVLLLGLLIIAVVFYSPQKVHADSYYPDGNGNGTPNYIEDNWVGGGGQTSYCARSPDPPYGQHTYHAIWFAPSTITPAYGATSYTTNLASSAYICPGVGYTYSSNINYYITGASAALSFPSGTTFNLGTINRGNIRVPPVYVPTTINLASITYDAWNYFDVSYWGEARPGGSYDCFIEISPGNCVSTTIQVAVWIVRPTPPPEPPTIDGSLNATCERLAGFATTQNGNSYNAELLHGPAQTPTGIVQNNIASGSSFSLSTTLWRDFNVHVYYVRVTDTANGLSRTNSIGRSPPAPGTCLQFRCNSITTTPSIITPGAPYTVTTVFNVVRTGTSTVAQIGSSGNSYAYYIRLSILPTIYPENQIGSGTISPLGANSATANISLVAPATIGSYNAASYIRNTAGTGGAILAQCPTLGSTTVSFVDLPFFVARGGDVGVGTAVAPICPGWGSGSATPQLKGWNNLNTPTYPGNPNIGAGTDIAVISRPDVDGFASAQNRLLPSPPIGLSFRPNVFGLFGGAYTNGIPCPTDYYATLPTSGFTSLAGSVLPQSLGNGVGYAAAGPLTIGNATGFNQISLWARGHRPVIYVNGDAYISENIYLYTNLITTVEEIPNFYVIVRGNIYISPNVNRIDGVYVAQPNGATGGKIYTCADTSTPTWTFPSISQINDAVNGCRKNTLTVNGAFIAKEVKLYRSMGTLNAANAPAEIFNAKPATWLATPCVIFDPPDCPGSGESFYEAITSLPPVL